MSLAPLIEVARGDAPADLILARARIVNTFTGAIERGNVAIFGDRIAGIGDYTEAKETIDLGGRFLAPGLIDGHTHLESSLLHPTQYARAVVPRGTTALVTDLHEIANVAGLPGMRYMRNWARRLPLDFFFMAPSCVPATDLETSGARLKAQDIRTILRWNHVPGLGEMMNFPGVIYGDKEVLEKVSLARGKVMDGHAPALTGKELNAYVAAGIGSDHESIARLEGEEKLRRGMHLMIREGSSEKNLEALLPLVTDRTYGRCLFVVDDRTSADLLHDGDMDAIIRRAIRLGLNPVRAIQLATINPAQYFRLEGLGAVAPGYVASLMVFDDLHDFRPDLVYYRGRLVAQGGQALLKVPPIRGRGLAQTMNIKPFPLEALRIPAERKDDPIIEVVPGQIITRKRQTAARVAGGEVVADTKRDILKLVVVERHRATGNIGRGLVTGFGLKDGALASSVAHDSHNIVAVGTGDRDLFAAIKEVERLQGGLVATRGEKVLSALPLPIAGLLSDAPLEEVKARLEKLARAARNLGCTLPSPFATLSFLALPVIPELRLTDKGLVDVTGTPRLIS
jgi:adenine deaminase